jgi:hypothetical protein
MSHADREGVCDQRHAGGHLAGAHGELQLADAATISAAIANESLSLWVQLQGGIRARLTYKLVPRNGHTEVVATMEPQGFRYALFRIITLGRADVNYEIALVEGLANLKRAVEGA